MRDTRDAALSAAYVLTKGYRREPLEGLPALLAAVGGKTIAAVHRFIGEDEYDMFREDITVVFFTDGTGLRVSLDGFFGGTTETPPSPGWVQYTLLTPLRT